MSHIDYNEDNPGPGTYWLNYKHVLPQAPVQSFGLRPELWFDYDKPGPGTYNLRKDGNDSPKYTMAQHCFSVTGLNVPGPGTYFLHDHVKHTNIRVPAYTLADRNNYHPDEGVPGPGTYNVREETPPSLGYSLGRRFTSKGSPTPDPGSYSPNRPSGSPKYSMGQHVGDAPRPVTPGVGAYNLRSQEFAGPRYTMGRKFYRLRDMKRERRYSRALKHRSNLMRSRSPPGGPAVHGRGAQNIAPAAPRIEIHRKHSSHIHVKPEIPRRASTTSRPPPTGALGTQGPPPPAAPLPEPVVVAPKSNAWMDVGKRLQRTRDAITAAASLPDPEEPPPG